MIDDPNCAHPMGPGMGTSELAGLSSSVARTAQSQITPAPAPPPIMMVASDPPKIRPGMTPEELRAYIDGTKQRASRQKPRPSLDKYEDVLRDLVKGKAVMNKVFDDLIAVDPEVLEEFGPDGHRTFNACVKRMFS